MIDDDVVINLDVKTYNNSLVDGNSSKHDIFKIAFCVLLVIYILNLLFFPPKKKKKCYHLRIVFCFSLTQSQNTRLK